MSTMPGMTNAPPRSDDLGGAADDRLDFCVRADDQEPAVLDRHRLDPRLGFVDGVDTAVGVNGVGSVALLSAGY